MSTSSMSQSAADAGSPHAVTSLQSWTWQEEKLFENALCSHDHDEPDRWEKIAAMVPGKDADTVKRHYELLVEDVKNIDLGKVALPSYPAMPGLECGMEPVSGFGESSSSKSGAASGRPPGVSSGNSSNGKAGSFKSAEQERRKGTPWTEEEHRLFLLGLEKYGKGDWRSISRNFVVSRTPTQVASHAQKYFIRLNSINKDRRRSSIHDITSVTSNGDGSQSSQGPITGQGPVASNLAHPAAPNLAGATVYGAPFCQPIVGPGGSTIGTPVPLQPAPMAGPYVTRGPLPSPGVPSPPVSGVPMVYAGPQPSVSQPAAQR
ncbi:hypothetical protein KP509_35G012200 [Ceratopteris richardii]|uniref:Uncharacterized protein n=1 Tax=Ceratopteris richardii TaxID=49495 RepID=A0A8T2QEN9_CERRI|nr:hypothetical protein KP509_35G012200 [Ceratopteris richardii]KAH7282108.1 hypothetical protein KP509_35G012200 [Ceratopteris richardii]